MAIEDDTDQRESDDPNLEGADPYADMSDEQAERMARRQGWTKEEDWDEDRAKRENRKKPAHFLSAKEFLRKIEGEVPLMRSHFRSQNSKIGSLESKLNEATSQIKEVRGLLIDQHNMSMKAKKAAYDQGIADARREMREAVKSGDEEAYEKAEKKLEEINQEQRQLEARSDPNPDKGKDRGESGGDSGQEKGDDEAERTRKEAYSKLDPETRGWLEEKENAWFHRGGAVQATMIEFNGSIKAENPDWTVREVLDEAARRTKAKFPEKFGRNPNREGQGAVGESRGGNRGDRGGGKKFEDLPAEAKATYARMAPQFEAAGQPYPKEDYAKDYFSQQ